MYDGIEMRLSRSHPNSYPSLLSSADAGYPYIYTYIRTPLYFTVVVIIKDPRSFLVNPNENNYYD